MAALQCALLMAGLGMAAAQPAGAPVAASAFHLQDTSSGRCMDTINGQLTVAAGCNVLSTSKAPREQPPRAATHIASGLASPLCLQASLSGLLALTAGCNQQYLQWQAYPASGASAYVNHTVTGLCLYPGSGPGVLPVQGTPVQLQGTCTDELADFVLTPSGFLRHQYSGLCAALNPAAPGTEPASPAALASQNAAVESAGVGSPEAPALLSVGKPSLQSSTAGSQGAGLANDGSLYTNASQCSSTQTAGAQYWQVDLGNTFQLVNISVLNRDTNAVGNPPFQIFAGNSNVSVPGTYTALDGTACEAYPVAFTQPGQVLTTPCSAVARYVVIKSTGGPLSFCEVEVYGYTPVAPAPGAGAVESVGNVAQQSVLLLSNTCTEQFTFTLGSEQDVLPSCQSSCGQLS
eukprot:jgi/Astpho2/5398/fgenesh1_pg.00076_%23_6_t